MNGSPLSFTNPYHNNTFWEFIFQFFHRLMQLILGKLSFQELATDEIQVFVLMGVAISSALVGTFLVLRRMTMLANSLSHTILIGIVLAYFWSSFSSTHEETHGSHVVSMNIMLFAAVIVGFLTTFLTEFLIKTVKLQEDASTGIVFTSLFAIGIILVTILTRNAHLGTETVMGNADALHREDIGWVYFIAFLNCLFLILFFKEYQITTFDPGLANAMGISSVGFSYLLMGQVSVTAITSFRAVGVLLVLAFMTGPVLSARLLTNRLKNVLIGSAGLGAFSALVGVALSRHIFTVYGAALSTAGIVVCTILAFYTFLAILTSIKPLNP